MNVLHFNQSDVTGGAAVAAYRLHQGLRHIGVNSRLLVAEARLCEETTTVMPPMAVPERAFFKLTYRLLPNQTNIWRTRRIFEEPAYRAADVIHLHNLHTGLYFNYLMLPRFTREKPVVLTLHDMWAFTGHCSFSLECERWRDHCGKCPHPDIYPAVHWDNTAIELWLKKSVYARSKLAVVAPSNWIANLARASILGRFPVHHIPNGIDTEMYRPGDRAEARRHFGLPPDKIVLFFACADLSEWRKGMDLLVDLLRALPAEMKEKTVLFTMGRPSAELPRLVSLPVVQAGYLEAEADKARAYVAADLFISTTRADNLPLVLQESLACGTPVVATDAGGVSDLARQGVTGFTAPPHRLDELLGGLLRLMRDEPLRRSMSEQGRRIAMEEWSSEAVARRHLALYESLPGVP